MQIIVSLCICGCERCTSCTCQAWPRTNGLQSCLDDVWFQTKSDRQPPSSWERPKSSLHSFCDQSGSGPKSKTQFIVPCFAVLPSATAMSSFPSVCLGCPADEKLFQLFQARVARLRGGLTECRCDERGRGRDRRTEIQPHSGVFLFKPFLCEDVAQEEFWSLHYNRLLLYQFSTERSLVLGHIGLERLLACTGMVLHSRSSHQSIFQAVIFPHLKEYCSTTELWREKPPKTSKKKELSRCTRYAFVLAWYSPQTPSEQTAFASFTFISSCFQPIWASANQRKMVKGRELREAEAIQLDGSCFRQTRKNDQKAI